MFVCVCECVRVLLTCSNNNKNREKRRRRAGGGRYLIERRRGWRWGGGRGRSLGLLPSADSRNRRMQDRSIDDAPHWWQVLRKMTHEYLQKATRGTLSYLHQLQLIGRCYHVLLLFLFWPYLGPTRVRLNKVGLSQVRLGLGWSFRMEHLSHRLG